MAEPWEKQPEESAKAFEAFAVYRDMGANRSLEKAGRILGKVKVTLEPWSSKFNWKKRAEAWDAEQDRIAREAQLSKIKKMRIQHANLANAMLVKAAKALQKIKTEDMTPNDIARMVDIGSKLERISRGDVGEVVEERNGGTATPAVQFYMPDNGRDKKLEE